ncbi:BnaA08g07550D [Brassica napus]|uniref:BnaA08g07550D protein n=1 Tax=Brassica napus TaxID=3708 RepID=A0A078GPJ7_BRANA|nr:BnaA08g07550D [Brassica napus]
MVPLTSLMFLRSRGNLYEQDLR